jgi:ATP-dependent helicase IRC3
MTPLALATENQIELRPYQHEALTAIEAAALRGVTWQVVSLPTGSGKTVIFAHLIVERQTRTLILVHRDELIRQTLDKLAMVAQGTALDVGIIKAELDQHAGDVVAASVQTLQREARLHRLAQTFGLVIVDEQTASEHCLPQCGIKPIVSDARKYIHINT